MAKELKEQVREAVDLGSDASTGRAQGACAQDTSGQR